MQDRTALATAVAALAMLAYSVAADPTPGETTPPLKVGFTEQGVPMLTLDGQTITQPTFPKHSPQVTIWDEPIEYRFPNHGSQPGPPPDRGQKPTDSKYESRYDSADKTLVYDYAWGHISRSYEVHDNRLDIHLQIKNTGERVLHRLAIPLLSLKLPGDSLPAMVTEKTFFGQNARTFQATNFTEPVVLPMVVQDNVLIAATAATEPNLQLRWSIPRKELRKLRKQRRLENRAEHGDPNAQELADQHAENVLGAANLDAASAEYDLELTLGGGSLVWHNRYMDWQLKPGQTTRLTISLRPGTKDAPLAPAQDILDAYREAHPMMLDWPDRRPIVRSFLGDNLPFHEATGPEFVKPEVQVTDKFRQRVMNHADQLIEDMKRIDAQGMIIWNVESNGGRLQYVGTPQMIEYFSPEMDAVADEFFKKIRDAGFRVGVCLRPSDIIIGQNDKGEYFYRHAYPRDESVVDRLDREIKYAKQRWGATLFYVDTNRVYAMPKNEQEKEGWPRRDNGKFEVYKALMNAEQWEELLRRNPDCLFTVEHTYARYYTSQAPYDQMNMGRLPGATTTPPLVRKTWPSAFKMLTVGYPISKYQEQMREAFANDDIVVVNPRVKADAPFINLARREAELLREGAPSSVVDAGRAALIEIAGDRTRPLKPRYHALRRLRLQDESVPVSLLTSLAQDPELALQIKAIEAIESPEHAPALKPLLAHIKHRNIPLHGVCVAAVKRVGDAGVEPIAEVLRTTERSADNGRRLIIGAARALRHLESTAARDALLVAATDTSLPTFNRWRAINQLDPWAADEPVIDAMLKLVDDPTLDPRTLAAAGLLSKSGASRARDKLQSLLAQEQEQDKPHPHRLKLLKKFVKSSEPDDG